MTITLDEIAQVGLTLFSVAAIFLVAKKNKWGFVIGLLSEPFWFITSYLNKQWGIFILTCVYTVTWAYGIYEWFYKEDKKKEPTA
jgi:nicotinamide riboside transporter PnuC